MKEKLLISIMLRNNQTYIPYFFQCIDLLENYNTQYDINYIVYTNNNSDNTLDLLKNTQRTNIKIIDKSYSKEFLDKPRVIKLHYLREDFLNIIREEHFDYLLMLDSDIIFNGKIVLDSIEILKNNNYNAITTNTITCNEPWYYDIFSLSTKVKDNYTPNVLRDRDLNSFYYDISYKNKNSHIDIVSAFGGFFLTTNEIIQNKDLSYIKGNKNISKDICEHKYFNSHIKNIKFICNINPFWTRAEGNQLVRDLDKNYTLIKENKTDNRNFNRFFSGEIAIYIYIALGILALLLFKKIPKIRKILGVFLLSIVTFVLYINFKSEPEFFVKDKNFGILSKENFNFLWSKGLRKKR